MGNLASLGQLKFLKISPPVAVWEAKPTEPVVGFLLECRVLPSTAQQGINIMNVAMIHTPRVTISILQYPEFIVILQN